MSSEIEVLKFRLGEWARWTASWQPKLGYPARVPFVALMKPNLVHEGEGTDEHIDTWAMQLIDASIESLPPILSKAIHARYLLHRHVTMADQAEERLVAIVQKKGLLLI